MVGGLIVLVVVLAVASAAGWGIRQRNGRFRAGGSVPGGAMSGGSVPGTPVPSAPVLSETDLGAELGRRATLVQFSTELCAYCGPTRELLTEVARSRDGVALVEIDAAQRMDLARRLNVFSTPTVFVLGPDGSIAQRSSGRQRKSDVLAAVSSVLEDAPRPAGEE